MYRNNNINKAMILAAGEGSRLKPLTSEIPKSLLQVGDKQIIVHQLYWLKYHGVTEVAKISIISAKRYKMNLVMDHNLV